MSLNQISIPLYMIGAVPRLDKRVGELVRIDYHTRFRSVFVSKSQSVHKDISGEDFRHCSYIACNPLHTLTPYTREHNFG